MIRCFRRRKRSDKRAPSLLAGIDKDATPSGLGMAFSIHPAIVNLLFFFLKPNDDSLSVKTHKVSNTIQSK